MDIETSKIFKKFADCEIVNDYSGRGMFGKTTTGIILEDETEFMSVIAEIMVSGEEEEREIVAEYLTNIKEDSMGFQKIFY